MTKEEDEKNNKKFLPLLLLLLGFVMIGGVSLAFFSDIMLGEASVTAGTLDLAPLTDGGEAIEFYLNGAETALDDLDVANFNPGDCITAKGSAKNVGSKSAHVRMSITATNGTGTTGFTNNTVYIAPGEVTLADITTATGATSLNSVTGPIVTDPVVINGGAEGDDTETETGIDTNEYTNDGFTVCFLASAGNEQQGKTADFDVRIEAVQYRNNTTPDWSDATSMTAEFGVGSTD